jgi:hypothetical protein
MILGDKPLIFEVVLSQRHSLLHQHSTSPHSCPGGAGPVSVGRRSPPTIGATSSIQDEGEDLEVEEAAKQVILHGLDGLDGLITKAHVTWCARTSPS